MTNQLAGSISEFYFEAQFCVEWTSRAYGDVNDSFVITDFTGADESLPGVEPVVARGDECDGAVDTGTGIPALTLLDVLEVYLQEVIACFHKGRDIHTEGIVTIGLVARFLTIEVDGRLRHRTVEE